MNLMEDNEQRPAPDPRQLVAMLADTAKLRVFAALTLAEPKSATSAELAATTGLTAREVDVLRLIAAGKSNPEIARELFVSEATVKTHVNHVFAKTGARDRAQAVRFAYQHGLVGERS